LSFSLN